MEQQRDGGQQEYDVVVIGAGPVGENLADRAVQGGLSAVIVEAELVGGECSYWACMPSKALLRSGAALRAARAVPGAAEAVTGGLDAAAVLRRRTSFTSGWDDAGQVEWLSSAGIDLVRGRGRLTAEREVTVATGDGERVLRARQAVAVCTGSAAMVPGELRDADPWTSREAVAAEEVPASLLVIGGGVVACELATVFTDLGSQVTMLVRGDRLLTGTEDLAGEAVASSLRERGATLRMGTVVRGARRDGEEVEVTTGDGEVLRAAELVVATGRVPRTAGLGLAVAGLQDGDPLTVDETLRVRGPDGAPVPWLYAAGDVNQRAPLTHQGKYQARAAGDAIVARATGAAVRDERWGAHAATADHDAVTQVIFTDPEVAAVGLTARQARQRGLPVRVVDQDLGAIAGAALHADGYAGTARLVLDTEREVVLGVTFVGPDVAELLHAATIAVVGEVPLARLWHAVPAYPTVSEVWLRLLESIGRPH